jgi:formylglycine-generating enzyme required for sulfatase activity
VANIAPVGTTTLGAGRWGQFDLAGEVFELNLDVYANYVSPCADCVNLMKGGGLGDGTQRTASGGRFDGYGDPPTLRALVGPTLRSYQFGLRCARTP